MDVNAAVPHWLLPWKPRRAVSDSARGTLCCVRDSYGSLRIGPFLCHSDSLVFYSDSFISFSLVCLSPSTVFHKLGVSVYGGKFSWCET